MHVIVQAMYHVEPHTYIHIISICGRFWEEVHFCIIINLTLCAILGILVDFWAKLLFICLC